MPSICFERMFGLHLFHCWGRRTESHTYLPFEWGFFHMKKKRRTQFEEEKTDESQLLYSGWGEFWKNCQNKFTSKQKKKQLHAIASHIHEKKCYKSLCYIFLGEIFPIQKNSSIHREKGGNESSNQSHLVSSESPDRLVAEWYAWDWSSQNPYSGGRADCRWSDVTSKRSSNSGGKIKGRGQNFDG